MQGESFSDSLELLGIFYCIERKLSLFADKSKALRMRGVDESWKVEGNLEQRFDLNSAQVFHFAKAKETF